MRNLLFGKDWDRNGNTCVYFDDELIGSFNRSELYGNWNEEEKNLTQGDLQDA